MKRILVIGEDSLTCALGEQLISELLPDWVMPLASINTKGITKLVPSLPRYIGQAKLQPVLCVADSDGKCVRELLKKWLPEFLPDKFSLRLAVPESESWLLADRKALANFLEIPEKLISTRPDEEPDPKRHLLNLARKSKNRDIRLEVVSQTDTSKQGNGYNPHLCHFVRTHWSAVRAKENSPSLNRAIQRVSSLGNYEPNHIQ